MNYEYGDPRQLGWPHYQISNMDFTIFFVVVQAPFPNFWSTHAQPWYLDPFGGQGLLTLELQAYK